MNRKLVVTVVAGLCAVLFAGAAIAQVKPAVLVKQRQAGMTLLGKYFGPLAGMAQGKIPFNAEVVARNASYLEVLSKLPWDGFQDVTANEKSDALPAVFKDPARFKKASETMQEAVVKLASVARSGDTAAMKAAIGAVGKACGGCHDNFREKS